MTLNADSQKLLGKTINNLKSKDHFTFVYFGDTRGGEESEINTTILNEVLHQIDKLPEKPAFILHGGDIANTGTVDNLNDFVGIVQRTSKSIPFFVIPGNHEVYQPDRKDNQYNLKNFHNIIGADKFVINITIPQTFDFHLLAENNVTGLSKNNIQYGFNDQDIRFMDNYVTNNTGRTVIAFHANPHLDCWRHGMKENQTRKFLDGVVNLHTTRIPLLLTSHTHGYSDFKNDNNQSFVLSGGGGAPLAEVSPTSCIKPIYNFVVFRVGNVSSSGSMPISGTVYYKQDDQWSVYKKLTIR